LSGRFTRSSNIKAIADFVTENNLQVVPHSPKDYNFTGLPRDNYLMSLEGFRTAATLDKVEKFTDKYSSFEGVVAMRGHGQLISIGANVPSLYLSTQDKVSNFSIKNGFKEYNIDVLEYDWINKLQNMHDRLLLDSSYVEEWYNIRDRCIQKCKKQFTSYCNQVTQLI
jgi:polysaccharide pyruvyl transferase WcaK-like protein